MADLQVPLALLLERDRPSCEPLGLTHARTLEGALRQLSETGADAILLEPDLPDSRAADAVGRIRSRFPELPIVVLSAQACEGEIVRALTSGANDYLNKPFTPPLLLAKVGLLLQNRPTQRWPIPRRAASPKGV